MDELFYCNCGNKGPDGAECPNCHSYFGFESHKSISSGLANLSSILIGVFLGFSVGILGLRGDSPRSAPPHAVPRVGSLVVGFLGRLTPTARQVYSDVLAKGTSSAVPLNLIVGRRELLPTGNFRSGQTPIQCRQGSRTTSS